MSIFEYLKDKISEIIIFILTLVLIIILFLFFNVHKLLLIYTITILILCYLTTFLINYYKRKRFYNSLFKSLQNLDKKYLIEAVIPNTSFLEGNILKDTLYEIDKCFLEEINKYKAITIDFREYIELWCHEIKIPLATIKLILENNHLQDKLTNKELTKIEEYVEQVLYYAKSDSVNDDYIIKEINLKEVIQNVIKRNKSQLIGKSIKIETFQENVIIKSDVKWLEFILNQIINNSIKYSKELNPKIIITYQMMKNNIILNIEDNGIGIKEEELTKVFDKGFTGSNGRSKYNSTGIGLYLCKKLCDKLDHHISIISTVNEKTIIKITFPHNSMINEII